MSWTIHLKGVPTGDACVAVEHEVYTFAGLFDATVIQVYVFNTVSLRWSKLTPMTTGREEHSFYHFRWVPPKGQRAVLIEYIIYIWGGTNGNQVLYALDVDTRRLFIPRISGTVPKGLMIASHCVLGKVIHIFGGSFHDVYKLDTTTMVWSLINTRGTPPSLHSILSTTTIIGTKMFVLLYFYHYKGYPGLFKVFDTETNLWLSAPSVQQLPDVPWIHSAFAYNGELYIIGGRNYCSQASSDVWKFNPETFSWKKVEPKEEEPGPMYAMCCCTVGDRVVLSGGDNLYILDFNPCMKTLCKLAVMQYGLEQSELPHNIRWELAAMTTNSNRNKIGQ